MNPTAAEAASSVTTWLPLGISVIALVGVIFQAVYPKRKESQLSHKEKLYEACNIFEKQCDELQDAFAKGIVSIFRDAGYTVDLTLEMPEGRTWYSISTALNAVERSGRGVGRLDGTLYDKAQAVHQSLKKEIEVVKRAAETAVHPERRDELRALWDETRTRSDALRQDFTRAVSKATN